MKIKHEVTFKNSYYFFTQMNYIKNLVDQGNSQLSVLQMIYSKKIYPLEMCQFYLPLQKFCHLSSQIGLHQMSKLFLGNPNLILLVSHIKYFLDPHNSRLMSNLPFILIVYLSSMFITYSHHLELFIVLHVFCLTQLHYLHINCPLQGVVLSCYPAGILFVPCDRESRAHVLYSVRCGFKSQFARNVTLRKKRKMMYPGFTIFIDKMVIKPTLYVFGD